MALFSMNRYLGEDDLDTVEVTSQSADILAKIKATAEARRRSLGIQKTKGGEEGQKEEDTVSNKSKSQKKEGKVRDKKLDRKRKKEETKQSKLGINDDYERSVSDEEFEKDVSVEKKRKKKKKKRDVTDCEMCGEEIKEIKSKKAGVKKQMEQITTGKERDDFRGMEDVESSDADEGIEMSKAAPVSPKENRKTTKQASIIKAASAPNQKTNKDSNRKTADSSSDEDEDDIKDESEDVIEGGAVVGGFTVLGNDSSKKPTRVKRLLPEWLASPSLMSADLKQTSVPVEKMAGIHPLLVTKLTEHGIRNFFPVQVQVIPEMLREVQYGYRVGVAGCRPRDLCVSAPTGSGKTLAFVLPIVQALMQHVECKVRALVVLPVRELAVQVYKVFRTYCHGTKLKVGMVTGKKRFILEQKTLVQYRFCGYESLVDILVATPGRLVDHIAKTEGFDLTSLRFLVIDEADRMMELIKQDWLREVEKAVYTEGREMPGALTVYNLNKFQLPLQKLLFSATLSQNPEKLQKLNLFQPKLFTSVDEPAVKPVVQTCEQDSKEGTMKSNQGDSSVKAGLKARDTIVDIPGKFTTPAGLTEQFLECTAAEKPLMVLHFLHNLKFTHVLCFTNSVESAHRLYHVVKLVGGVTVQEVTGKVTTEMVTKAIQRFAKGKIDILICSDAMARGMDIENVRYVISYDPPKYIKTYIHRVGRTARAGKEGTAISLVQSKEFYHFKKMTREVGKTDIRKLNVREESLKPLVPKFQAALKQLSHILKMEKRREEQQR